MWELYIYSSAIAKKLSTKISSLFSINVETDYSEHEHFFFSSPFLDMLDIENSNLAFFRAKAMIRILNGILELNNEPIIVFNENEIRFTSKDGKVSVHSINYNSQLEYEALQNPFDVSTLTSVELSS